ncbi:hypothetical protein AGDE_11646 [Angomonas deanei]|nr:hypothetical protein AGDE_11646 [Angomonas deanei]|eukprot:EPY25890.1 hypothetical protein AGDE_11646 [Angomonas deanei]
MEDQLGVRIPVVGIRAAVNAPHLREKVLDDLYEYGEILAESGSTPHRRAAMEQLEKFPVSEGEIPALTSSEQATQEKEVELSPNLEKAVSAVLSPPAASAKDEKKLIEILTSFAEGCVLKNQMDEAYTTLSGALKFAHGDETRSVTHANVATSALLNGKLKEAEFHSRESALLGTAPKRTPSGKRGYALWAATVAYQDDFARAERIVDEALQLYEAAPSDVSDSSTHDTTSLRALKEKIHELGELNANMDPSLRGARKHFHADRVRGIEEGSGKSFQNEFDWVLFKNKLYPSKMNPGTNEMGSVFRRVGDLGGAISTSRSMEPL